MGECSPPYRPPTATTRYREGLLDGKVSVAQAQAAAGARGYVEDVSAGVFDNPGDRPMGTAYAVILAAANILYEALDMSTFDRIDIDEHTQEYELDAWSNDAAGHGAIALAGGTYWFPYNSTKGREYWQWWLAEAVPQAYGYTQHAS